MAIERPEGLLVERLPDAGLRVLALHPNQVAATRARFRVSGGKSDRFDAFVLCELARTDSHRFRVLEPDSDETKALRALTRAREDLVHTKDFQPLQLAGSLHLASAPRSSRNGSRQPKSSQARSTFLCRERRLAAKPRKLSEQVTLIETLPDVTLRLLDKSVRLRKAIREAIVRSGIECADRAIRLSPLR